AILEDVDGNGEYDRAIEFALEITDSQGLYWIGRQLYVSGRGPSGDGLYRVTDNDGNDQADKLEMLTEYRGGIGGHGPHAVTLGPDGMLYHVVGNHAWIVEEESPTSPVRQDWLYEGDVLPRYEDPRGHAAGIRAPGATIWRCNRDGTRWELVASGMRNPYDAAFNATGDLFTFDADMEWDVGLPWYRPTRVLHCTPGAEFGWRSGSAKWPEHYPDSLPALIDVGRGSPTGVACYQHNRYPAKYRDSLWLGDWTNGRILVHHLTPQGATYSAVPETFATGEPMNVTDLEVGPDGCVYFSTGGWGTAGGVFRIVWSETRPASNENVDLAEQAIQQPQPLAAWAVARADQIRQRLGTAWRPALEAIAADRQRTVTDRLRALDALQIHGPPASEQLALSLVRDEQSALRCRAAALLGNVCTPEASQGLVSLLHDSDAVRRSAAASLAQANADSMPRPCSLCSQIRTALFDMQAGC
ncbi:MAG: HEAT repeat domain-containing protein, partial [Planctomycetes bacterium]|nr:HEAT repeat domain-containing protein [Planctomycetota bacterium]